MTAALFRRVGFTALCAASLAALAAPVLAQSDASSIEGRWCFETEAYVSFTRCSMRGEIALTRTGEGEYRCTMLTEETCEPLEELITSEQVCRATRDGAALDIESAVVSYTTPNGGSYLPDYFALNIASGAEMSGTMFSPGAPKSPDEPDAVFTRCADLVS